jgi:hypothetical protein
VTAPASGARYASCGSTRLLAIATAASRAGMWDTPSVRRVSESSILVARPRSGTYGGVVASNSAERRTSQSGGSRAGNLRAVESCLRAHGPGANATAGLGAVAFFHRFGSTLNAHMHFHCAVIDGVFDAAAGGVVFHAAAGLDATAITQVQAQGRRRLLRVFVRRSLPQCDDAQAMAQWEHGGGFSVDASVRIAAANRAGRSACCATLARPPFALGRLHELDPEHLLYGSAKQGAGRLSACYATPDDAMLR